MSAWKQIKRIWQEPPPAHVFEISAAGVAWSREVDKNRIFGFQPFDSDVLAISPLKDNVVRPEQFFELVRSLAPENGKFRNRATAVILPDYSARVAVLDFDNFPAAKMEQESLIRFRLKRSIPFDLGAASVSYYPQAGAGSKKHEVVAAAAALEIIARYEAAFRNAGFEPGFVTTSTLAALNLVNGGGVSVMAKLNGTVMSAAVVDGTHLRLLRCVELPESSLAEVLRVLFPTFAYVEDELGTRPGKLLHCGFGGLMPELGERAAAELDIVVEPLRASLGQPDETNAGLLGFLDGAGE